MRSEIEGKMFLHGILTDHNRTLLRWSLCSISQLSMSDCMQQLRCHCRLGQAEWINSIIMSRYQVCCQRAGDFAPETVVETSS
jgi:hypothetical protein